MTEDEAKTKWCPMRRIVRIGDVRIDNTDGNEFTLNCIGFSCMMWRWKYENPHDRESKGGITLPERLWPGYCGLGGKEEGT